MRLRHKDPLDLRAAPKETSAPPCSRTSICREAFPASEIRTRKAPLRAVRVSDLPLDAPTAIDNETATTPTKSVLNVFHLFTAITAPCPG